VREQFSLVPLSAFVCVLRVTITGKKNIPYLKSTHEARNCIVWLWKMTSSEKMYQVVNTLNAEEGAVGVRRGCCETAPLLQNEEDILITCSP